MLDKKKLLSDLIHLIDIDKERLNDSEKQNKIDDIIRYRAYLSFEETLVGKINKGDYDFEAKEIRLDLVSREEIEKIIEDFESQKQSMKEFLENRIALDTSLTIFDYSIKRLKEIISY